MSGVAYMQTVKGAALSREHVSPITQSTHDNLWLKLKVAGDFFFFLFFFFEIFLLLWPLRHGFRHSPFRLQFLLLVQFADIYTHFIFAAFQRWPGETFPVGNRWLFIALLRNRKKFMEYMSLPRIRTLEWKIEISSHCILITPKYLIFDWSTQCFCYCIIIIVLNLKDKKSTHPQKNQNTWSNKVIQYCAKVLHHSFLPILLGKWIRGGLRKHPADIQGNTLYEAKREFTQF